MSNGWILFIEQPFSTHQLVPQNMSGSFITAVSACQWTMAPSSAPSWNWRHITNFIPSTLSLESQVETGYQRHKRETWVGEEGYEEVKKFTSRCMNFLKKILAFIC